MVSLLAAALATAFVFLFSSWIATIPSVAIAAILGFTGVTLVDPRVYQRLWRLHRFSMLVAGATTFGVVAVGVLPGILLGVVLSLLGVLTEIVRPQDALLGCVEGSTTLHDVGDDDAATTIPGLVVYRFYGPLIFANVRFFIERIEGFIAQEDEPMRQVILDARAIPSIDITAAEELRNYVARLRTRGIDFVIAKPHLPLRETVAAISAGAIVERPQFSQLADAAFHATLPSHAFLYGLPHEYYEKKGVRRYGFHGSSHSYVALAAAQFLHRRPGELDIVSCHLGNGASLCAIDHGRSVDTTMGFTPGEGLIMGTRCGDLDPGLGAFLERTEGLNADQLDELLNKKSGLPGLSGTSGDVREIERAAEAGDARALTALKTFC